MDPEQFNQLMALQREMFEALLDKNKTNCTLIPNFEPFDQKKESFKNYKQRFENYTDMKGVKNNPQYCAKLLLHSIGPTHYEHMAALSAPVSLSTLAYADLLELLEKHLSPKKNVLVAQHQFLCKYQAPEQSIEDFVASLRSDIAACEFVVLATCPCEITSEVSVADVFLRAQFIRGLKDASIREKLLQSTTNSFQEIVAEAIACAASKIDAAAIGVTSSSSNEVYRVGLARGRSPSRHRANGQGQSRQPSINGRPPKVDYKTLGIANLCIRCGRDNHSVRECRINRMKLQCKSCGKTGHVAKVCITTLLKAAPTSSIQEFQNASDSEGEDNFQYSVNSVDEIVELFSSSAGSDKYFVHVTLNGKQQRFEVDSGAKFTVLNEPDFRRLNLKIPLISTSIVFKGFTGNLVAPLGKVNVQVQYKEKKVTGELFIVPPGHENLLGRNWIRELDLDLKEIDTENFNLQRVQPILQSTVSSPVPTDIFKEFSQLFEPKVGCVPGVEIALQLRENAGPIYTKERNVPHALIDKVNKELDDLEAAGIITPVTSSDWGSPLVCIPKVDGGVRLCVDYKCGVNERLVQANYPIRKVEDVINSLRNSRFFCVLDIFKAYLHLKVDTESSKIQTISTHRGTYAMNRLSFGIKTAPSEFNRILSQLFRGLPKTEAYFDDLIVHGATKDECAHNLRLCLQRLKENDLHLQKNKCKFFQERIEYLGHIIEHNKVKKSPEKVRAVLEMPRPQNTDDLQHFLGLVTYYAKFIPDLSTITYPLRQLLKKNMKWFWSRQCEAAFLKLKTELCSERVLVPFDPTYPIILATDASPTGIAAVLSHNINGEERPIAYSSRSLTPAEQNYSQLDREALAIVFGVTHFYYYLFGAKFILVTDNAPVARIFQHNKNLPQMTSSRLLRYASFLSGFNYTISNKKSVENLNADCLSRAAVQSPKMTADQSFGEEVAILAQEMIFYISTEEITASTIREQTGKDPEYSKIVRELKEKPDISEFTLVDGIIFRNDRILIPKSLQPAILRELHSTHVGITKMKQLARRYVYWVGIDKDIEHEVKKCESCALTRAAPAKVIPHQWDEPENNWDRIHIDYAGPLDNKYLLICVDAKSKWAEVRINNAAPTSFSTMVLLNSIFSSHGFPQVMVSDNASIFQSEEFKGYSKRNGIFQKFIAPGHAATNGLAERNVQTIKNKLKASSNEKLSLQLKIEKILFRYRATPLRCGATPAELYLNRKIRIKLDAIFPYKPSPNRNIPRGSCKSYQVGENVQTLTDKDKWQFGVIVKKLGRLHYIVQLQNGRSFKRHIEQLRSSMVQKRENGTTDTAPRGKIIKFGPTQIYGAPALPATTVSAAHQPPALPAIIVSPGQQSPALPAAIVSPVQQPTALPGTQSTSIRDPSNFTTSMQGRAKRERRPPIRMNDYVT